MLDSNVNVKLRYQRSTRIDTDLDDRGDFFDGLVFHGTAQNTLTTIAKGFDKANKSTFTITGPYGSGKSTIALLIAGLLSPTSKVRKRAIEIVGTEYAKEFATCIPNKKGWAMISIVADYEHPSESLARGLNEAARRYKIDFKEAVAHQNNKQDIKQVLDFCKAAKKYNGVLILLDEMGKNLDYLANNNEDLQLFQELAEAISRAKTNTLLIGFLHQAFAEYAAAHGQSVRENWAKVQGRYDDVLFNVSEDETITLLGNSLTHVDYKADTKLVERVLESIPSSSLVKVPGINQKLVATLPLHPVVSALLGPISKRRFSQNERSTFSFLSSAEPNGFNEFLASAIEDDLYRVSTLYDYLEENLDHLIASSPDARAWNEAKDAVERVEQTRDDHHLDIVKTTALLNLFGRKLGLYPNQELISACLANTASESDITSALAELVESKVLIFRKHLNSFAVFEGSDVDIESELSNYLADNKDSREWISFLESKFRTVAAKRHYHETGTMRWASLTIRKDLSAFEKSAPSHNQTHFCSLCLLLEGDAKSASIANTNNCFGTSTNIVSALHSIVLELMGLDYISQQNELIQHDRIARKELASRRASTLIEFDHLFERLISDASWFSDGQLLKQPSISGIVSGLADKQFNEAPQIFNELINRNKPSGTANAAKNKLLKAIVEQPYERNLGIEGFPPEMAMYKSCIESFGLHIADGEDFKLQVKQVKSKKLASLFSAFDEFINTRTERIVTVEELLTVATSSPFGVTDGVATIWMLCYLYANVDDLAFYDNDVTNKFVYITEPDEEFATKLAKKPSEVGVRRFVTDSLKRSHLVAIRKSIGGNASESSTLQVAKELVTQVSRLPSYVKSTKQLSKTALKFRDLVLRADDPNKLLLEDIPALFPNQDETEASASIAAVMEELTNKRKDLLSGFKLLVEKHVGKITPNFHSTAVSVSEYSSSATLKTFALRLSEVGMHDTEVWLANLLSFLSGKAERNWNDTAVEKARVELIQFAQRYKQAAYFAENASKFDQAFEARDHSDTLTQVDHLLDDFSPAEKAVILKKKLQELLAEA